MPEPEKHELIIVRRYEEEDHEPHSSAWKVAHADFMTAMMAFFLIMWLINVTDEEVRKSIANYFNPVRLSESVTDRKGLNDPQDIHPQGPEKPGEEKTSLAGKALQSDGKESGSKTDATGEKKAAKEAPGQSSGGEATAGRDAGATAVDPERAAFSDPYGFLAELAAEVPARKAAETPGSTGYRDPFEFDLLADERRGRGELGSSEPRSIERKGHCKRSDRDADFARRGECQEWGACDGRRSGGSSAPAAPITKSSQNEAVASDVKAKLTAALRDRLGSIEAPQLEVKAVPEGVLISLTDNMNFSMFGIGSAIPVPAMVVAMEKVADVLASERGGIVIRGHTDGRPFHSDTYDNWRLSSARAHMTYYMLTRGKLPEARIQTIEGFADRDLKNPADPYAAENRRIEVLLRVPGS